VKFFVKTDRKADATMDLVQQWSQRFPRLRSRFVFAIAEVVREALLERIPKGDEWAAYRDSLETVRVQGAPKNTTIFSLRSNPSSRRVRQEDVPRTVLYVRPRTSLARKSQKIEILAKFSPWTIQTLPFTPKKSEATVITRRVTPREVERVEKARKKDRIKWQKELSRHGVRVPMRDRKLQARTSVVEGIPDVAFEALRLEFGLGQVNARPHWRPALKELVMTGVKGLLRQDPELRRIVFKRGYSGWKKAAHTRKRIRMSEARRYLEFQRRLGIRVSRDL
jgi:hypothetical protein